MTVLALATLYDTTPDIGLIRLLFSPYHLPMLEVTVVSVATANYTCLGYLVWCHTIDVGVSWLLYSLYNLPRLEVTVVLVATANYTFLGYLVWPHTIKIGLSWLLFSPCHLPRLEVTAVLVANFYTVRNYKIAKNSTTTKTREKISTVLESLEF